MTALTYILGGVSLKVLRHQLGRLGYWLLTAVITGGLFAAHAGPLAVAFLSLVVLMGVFSELEELHLSFLWSSFFTLLLNCLIAGGAMALWVSRVGPKWSTILQSSLETLLQPLTQINSSLKINYADLVYQIPSIVLVLWMAAIYLAVLLEGRLNSQEGPKKDVMESGFPSMRRQLSDLRMPDAVVWIFILALLGAFGGFDLRGVESISVNILNISFVLFFFQGIAVVARFFEKLKMGSFWQGIFMILIVVHLFLFVSLLGLMDYWLDFRSRFNKRPQEYKGEAK